MTQLRKLAASIGILFVVYTSLLFSSPAAFAADNTPPVGNTPAVMAVVTCAQDDGTTKDFNVVWNTNTQFFDGKGNIAALFCKIASQGYSSLVSAAHRDGTPLSDSEMYYNGIPNGELAPIVTTPGPTAQPTPQPSLPETAAPTPSPTETTPAVEPTVPPQEPTTPVQPSLTPIQETHDYVVNENETLSVTAPAGSIFATATAWYGDPNNYNCGVYVSDIVGQAFVGKTDGSIVANNSNFGDPCGGVYKILWADFTYTVAPATAVVEPPVVSPPVILPPDPQPTVPTPPVVQPPVPVVPVVPPVVEPPVVPVVVPVPPVDKPLASPTPVAQPPAVAPPAIEPPVSKPVEPSQPPITQADPATIDPSTLSPQEVNQLQAVAETTLSTAPESSPAYQQALEQLAVAAQADDIKVDPALANTPVVGAAVIGVVNAINAIGNIGADMSPAHRVTAKKEVVAAVVVTGAAVSAAGAAAASSGASSSSSRRKEK